MFKRVLIANRGEIAVRIIRACRELGVKTVALYELEDIGSLHVRLADECVQIAGVSSFFDGETILSIAREKGADAIHPGYGYLAEQPEFVRRCEDAAIQFIGPSPAVLESVLLKLQTLSRARAAGYPTVPFSPIAFQEGDFAALAEAADHLGYPVKIKPCFGGRGPGERLVYSPAGLERAYRSAQEETASFFHHRSVYLEKAILPSYEIGVQVICDRQGEALQLGTCQILAHHGNRQVISESPAPVLSTGQQDKIQATAVDLARLFGYENLGTVEFLVDEQGHHYFTEFKARIQLKHPLAELFSRLDLVRTQIRLAAGEPLAFHQADLPRNGTTLLCQVSAEDPWNNYLPSPGRVEQLRLPGGPDVRVDTYLYEGCEIPGAYDPLVAKLIVWAEDRQAALERMRRALEEFKIVGICTNITLLQNILSTPDFIAGRYSNAFQPQPGPQEAGSETHLRDLAAAAALMYMLRDPAFQLQLSAGRSNGWHRNLHIPPRWSYTGIHHEKNGD